MKFLVSHPHASAFSNTVADGLRRAGMLASYTTGIAAGREALSGRLLALGARRFGALHNRIFPNTDHLRSLFVVEAAARATANIAGRIGAGPSQYDAVFVAHDLAAAAHIRGADAVYAYEDAALATFTRARRRDMPCVWDLPLPHYATLERMWAAEHRRFPDAEGAVSRVEPAWKKRRKDDELALCTHVMVASDFTAASLVDTGCEKPIFKVPYGFPTEAFLPKITPQKGPFQVLAVGSQNLRKGTPYLLQAWQRLAPKNAELVLVGPMGLSARFLSRYEGIFTHVPHVPKRELADWYQKADLLAFPTLGDGFGLVLQEAMCSGTPVMTTRCGGGPECITDGEDGFIIEERNVDAIIAVLEKLIGDKDRAFAYGQKARARSERYTVRDAGSLYAKTLREL